MKAYSELKHYGGLDWAKRQHQVYILDGQGQVVERFKFEHSGPGWAHFRERIQPYPDLGMAIETSSGAVVDQLLQSGVRVWAVHPQAAKAYRQRQAPSGVKDDDLDAWSLANALRTDGMDWRPLRTSIIDVDFWHTGACSRTRSPAVIRMTDDPSRPEACTMSR